MKASPKLVGKRIKLIKMNDDPNPIASGEEGLVYNVGADIINVQWDNGRNLGLVDGLDTYSIITED